MRKKVCAAVIRRNGRTLICSRPKATILGDKMEFPGGKVEPGESLNECIVRELKEELNAEILPLDVACNNPQLRLLHSCCPVL